MEKSNNSIEKTQKNINTKFKISSINDFLPREIYSTSWIIGKLKIKQE